MTILAPVNSGLSERERFSPTKRERCGSAAGEMVSTLALPPAGAAAKAETRTVTTFFKPLASTVSIAFPA